MSESLTRLCSWHFTY